MPPNKRPRTEPIVRVRTGCYTCRRRKKKCDEVRPSCGGCVRNKLNCEWPANVPTSSTRPNGPNAIPPQTVPDQPGSPCTTRTCRGSSASPSSPSASVGSPSALSNGFEATEAFSPPTEEQAALLVPMGYSHATPRSSISGPDSPTSMTIGNLMPRSLSMLPGYSPESFQLLSHYLATTADVMANGSTPVNPFLVQIVPLAFSSDLLLQLVLTQSAAHRAFRCRNDSDEVAQNHYTKALQLFRKGVTEFIDGKESNPLMLTVGALVMCFTETAKGDMNGTIFDHLSAANSLLTRLLSLSDAAVPKDLKDFVIEYYTYTAAVSMISIDARVSHQLLLNFDLEQKARQLLELEYVGNLCGCWLELLLMIPCIFDLGRQWMMLDGQPTMPTADDIAMFGSLQAQIMRWNPFSFVTPEVFLAGRVFQQAMLLYLYTCLGSFSRTEHGMHQGLINTAITEAMSYLNQLSATARINSGLCWPIAVVGSCLYDVEQQEQLRQRLATMVNTFGLGNMQRTLLLLENMWQMPLDEAGPWNICRAMQQHQIWISFA
ncbi:fungal-specific transcription factor domain-containing protein [Aspergillus bertholletiae]|uniref:Fungal-specific transcription factor domain-containing protein n=1 Tax=Aspergillus bertholletiae TaxID=1226010 RepID=A0A5N7B764_9EURO|nr:fungal-specific transcription factor domain-containing protein [Aspergillus bertholletiae]